MQYWLMKTEPGTYSIDDLLKQKKQTDFWEGVRNYQARNFMREMKKGDLAFFYHSVVRPPAIVGIVEIVREAYPDHTQFEPESKYYDPKSNAAEPRWDMVDIKLVRKLDTPFALDELKKVPGLEKMALLQKGSRLSIQKVTKEEWEIINKLATK